MAVRWPGFGRAIEARLERDGSVSVVGKKAEPRILEIDVAPGVQTVRVELS